MAPWPILVPPSKRSTWIGGGRVFWDHDGVACRTQVIPEQSQPVSGIGPGASPQANQPTNRPAGSHSGSVMLPEGRSLFLLQVQSQALSSPPGCKGLATTPTSLASLQLHPCITTSVVRSQERLLFLQRPTVGKRMGTAGLA